MQYEYAHNVNANELLVSLKNFNSGKIIKKYVGTANLHINGRTQSYKTEDKHAMP